MAALVLASLALGSCANDPESASKELSVFAASSLADTFQRVAAEFEQAHPNQTVLLNLGSSSQLAAQIEQGARADVFASADRDSVDRVIEAGFAEGPPRVFTRNRLALVIPPQDPGDVDELADLEREEIVISLCDKECPAGIYARRMLGRAGLEVRPDSLEPEVRGVVTRVRTGEADAGIVYASDAIAAGNDLRRIPIPDSYNVVASYPIVVLEGAPPQAGDLVDLLLSPTGQRILAEAGFLPR